MSDNCEFNFANILVPLSVDVFVPQESLLVTNASCPGDVGQITGSVDGPTGVYEVWIDGNFVSEVSVGVNDLEFGTLVGGTSILPDCEGNDIFLSDNSSIVLSGFNGLQDGDWIGAFYDNPSCGYSLVGNLNFSATILIVLDIFRWQFLEIFNN